MKKEEEVEEKSNISANPIPQEPSNVSIKMKAQHHGEYPLCFSPLSLSSRERETTITGEESKRNYYHYYLLVIQSVYKEGGYSGILWTSLLRERLLRYFNAIL